MAETRAQSLLQNLGLALGLRRSDREAIDVTLEANGTWSGTARAETLEIRCVSGTVWVTLEGDRDDHVLLPGETFVGRRAGRVAMMAFAPSRVLVARRTARPRESSLVRQESSAA